MGEVIDFKFETQAVSHLPMTDDEIRLANIYDIAVDLIFSIEQKQIISLEILKAQMIEIIEIIQEEL